MSRYFYLYDGDKIVSLFKLDVDDEAKTFDEFMWTSAGWVKSEYGRVFSFVMNGAHDMLEVSSEEVSQSVPAALKN
jgi:hypothetical protein